jgi:hypothetical protein
VRCWVIMSGYQCEKRNLGFTSARPDSTRFRNKLIQTCSVARKEEAEAMDPVVVVAVVLVCTLGLVVVR